MDNSVKVLIVEDEYLIAEDIAMRLEEMGFGVTDTVDNVDEAIRLLEKNSIDILLIDISLRGTKSGIDLAEVINERFHLPFVFLTSLANQSILEKARQVKPAAYLLKPFNDRQVKVAIELALFNFYGEAGKTDNEDEKIEPDTQLLPADCFLPIPGCLFLRNGNSFLKVLFDDILWLEADSNYTIIHTRNGKFTYSCVLKKFEEKLPSNDFVRVHRSFIVNLKNVTGFEGNLLLIGDKEIPVNRSYKSLVFKRFRII